MKIVVVGAKGVLGSELARVLACEHDVTAWDVDEVDITDRAGTLARVTSAKPDLIVNVDVEACEKQPDAAWKVNAVGSQNLALAARPDQPVWKVKARGGKARSSRLADDVHREDLLALRSPAEKLRGPRVDRCGYGWRCADGRGPARVADIRSARGIRNPRSHTDGRVRDIPRNRPRGLHAAGVCAIRAFKGGTHSAAGEA
jgi:hypothetical protein